MSAALDASNSCCRAGVSTRGWHDNEGSPPASKTRGKRKKNTCCKQIKQYLFSNPQHFSSILFCRDTFWIIASSGFSQISWATLDAICFVSARKRSASQLEGCGRSNSKEHMAFIKSIHKIYQKNIKWATQKKNLFYTFTRNTGCFLLGILISWLYWNPIAQVSNITFQELERDNAPVSVLLGGSSQLVSSQKHDI